MTSSLPHEWLGRDFRELLPSLAGCDERVTLTVTRPSGRSYGEGALRVVAVRTLEGRRHLVLAYERYLPPYSKKSGKGRRGSRRKGSRDGSK